MRRRNNPSSAKINAETAKLSLAQAREKASATFASIEKAMADAIAMFEPAYAYAA